MAKLRSWQQAITYIRQYAVEAVQTIIAMGVLRLFRTPTPTWQLLGEDEEAEYLRAIAGLCTLGEILWLLHFTSVTHLCLSALCYGAVGRGVLFTQLIR